MNVEFQPPTGEKNNYRIYFTLAEDTPELNVFTEEGVKIKMNLDEEIEFLFLLSHNENENELLSKALMKRLKIKERKSILSFEEKLKDQYPFLNDPSIENIGI